MRKRIFNKAIKDCPIPVYFPNKDHRFGLETPGNEFFGCLGTYDRTNNSIFLGVSIPNHAKYAILLHELGHKLFWQYWKLPSSFPVGIDIQLAAANELSAYRFSLSRLLKEKKRQSLKWVMRNIDAILKEGIRLWIPHYRAAETIKSLPIWQECKEFLKNGRTLGKLD